MLSIVKKFWKTSVFSLHNQLQSFMILFFWILIYPLFRNSPKQEEKGFQTTLWFVPLLSWNAKVSPWFPILSIIFTIIFWLRIFVALIFLVHFLLIGLLIASWKILITKFSLKSWKLRCYSFLKKVL